MWAYEYEFFVTVVLYLACFFFNLMSVIHYQTTDIVKYIYWHPLFVLIKWMVSLTNGGSIQLHMQ